jgi:hypothetical protein
LSMKLKTDKNSQIEEQECKNPPLTQEQRIESMTLAVMGWLIPGAAHFKLGDMKRAILFFILLNGLFYWGMTLRGEIAFPILDLKSNEFNFVNILVFFLGIGNGMMTCLNMLPFARMGDISVTTYEIGTLFMVVSGAMNVFVTYHAIDLYHARIWGQEESNS